MSDEIIEELWQIKDSMAQAHDHDIESLAVHLQSIHRPVDQPVVDLRSQKRSADQVAPTATDERS